MKLNLTSDQITWATAVWKSAVDSKQSDSQSVQEYMEALFQPSFDKLCSDAANSWKPTDSPEVADRRDSVTAQLAVIPQEKLQQFEAILTVSKDDTDEVSKRRSDAVAQLLTVPEQKLKEIEDALAKEAKPVDAIAEAVAEEIKP